ncbi:MAG: hypothetical protein ACYC27_09640 [Armatimonadota bacterium]
MNKRYRTALLIISLALMTAVSVKAANPEAPVSTRHHTLNQKKVVMIVMPGMTMDDLVSPDLPNIRGLLDTGAIGLMNSRSAGQLDAEEDKSIDPKYAPESGYLTIGSGARAAAGSDARRAFDRDAKIERATAADVFKRRTLTDPGDAEIVHIGIARIQRDNSSFNYQVVVGALGKSLREAGLKTAVVGNSDDTYLHREIVTIPMDDKGLVDYGSVGTSPDTDTIALLPEIERYVKQADFTVIELGDSGRLERAAPDMLESAYNQHRKAVMQSADTAIGMIMKSIDMRITRLIILSPYPSYRVLEQTGNTLCPIAAAGNGIQHGLLTSASTRAPGIVSNMDIAPSILEWLGVPVSSSFVGRPVSAMTHDTPISYITGQNRLLSVQANNLPVLRQVAVAIIVLVALVTLLWFTIPGESSKRRRILSVLILLPPAAMPALLLTALQPTPSRIMTWVWISAITLLITLTSLMISRKPMRALMIVSLLFTSLAAIDITTGGTLCSHSIIGYSVVDGSRYYGIGNEIMGILVGSSITGICLLADRLQWSRRVMQIMLAAGLIIGAVIIGAPSLGANTGGTIAVVTAFAMAITTLSKSKPGLRSISIVVLCVVSILSAIVMIDLFKGQDHESHLGRAVGVLASGGFEQIALMIKRKLAMNILLVRMSVWSKLLAAYILSIVLIIKLYAMQDNLKSLPMHIRTALAGILGGTVAAFVFNDSGVVAAGTCLLYAWGVILLTLMNPDKKQRI